MGGSGKALVKKAISHYRNACLEATSEELAPIWFRVKSKSSEFKQVSKSNHASGTTEKERLVKDHLREVLGF